jgi:Icc-related predicted phosphoesterase
LSQICSKIPKNIDILVTHCPPYNILDLGYSYNSTFKGICELCSREHDKEDHWGSKVLKEEIFERIKPKIHLFGHAHESPGKKSKF